MDGAPKMEMPNAVGLCPVHFEYFYMPEPDAGELCPECDQTLLIYAPAPETNEEGK